MALTRLEDIIASPLDPEGHAAGVFFAFVADHRVGSRIRPAMVQEALSQAAPVNSR
jgi:hypothetical protein